MKIYGRKRVSIFYVSNCVLNMIHELLKLFMVTFWYRLLNKKKKKQILNTEKYFFKKVYSPEKVLQSNRTCYFTKHFLAKV